MSDLGDRGRRRKKRGIKIKESVSPVSLPRPIILVKPSAERQTAISTLSEIPPKIASKPIATDPIPTTVLLRSRDDSGTPPHTTQINSSTGTTTTTTSTTTILQKNTPSSGTTASTPTTDGSSSSFENRLAPPTEMKIPVKLIDENLQWCDHAVEFLQDQSDYFVVGVIGLQGVGKSTLMSYLAGNKPNDSPKSYIFKAQSKDLKELGEHCTNGIDVFITSERIILLDVQPLLSASVMDHMMQYEKKYSTEYPSVESALEIQSLQIASFLMAVCHAILLVQDWFSDVNLLRFIHTAEMLKPSTLATVHDSSMGVEDQTEHYPYFVFVQTRCHRDDFTRASLVQAMYSSIFSKSKLKFRGPLGLGQKYVIPSFSFSPLSDSDSAVNLFFIPDKYSPEPDFNGSSFPSYQGHPGYATLISNLCAQVTLLPRSPLTRTAHSEKNWFHYAARTWELVKKSNLFMEFSRLLP